MGLIQTQKKKKKIQINRLLINFDCLEKNEIIATISEMRVILRKTFREHIGEDEAISPPELFELILGISPEQTDIYKREYWWNIIKTVIRGMRADDSLFIINKGTKLFVLKTQNEANKYKQVIDRDIKALKNNKKKADKWVRDERWKDI